MIKKQTFLSFAFCALILSSTLTSMISCATPSSQAGIASTKTPSVQLSSAQQDPATTELIFDSAQPANTQRKTAGQRIISGLAHTTLLGTSLIYLVSTRLKDFTATDKIVFALLGIRGSCASLKGVYHAIAKSEVASCEEPVTLNPWTAADSALLIPSLFLLKGLLTGPDKLPAKLFFSLPAFYALGTSIQTIYKIAQNHHANSDSQEPEIQTITE